VSAEVAVAWLREAARAVHERREWLTGLDAAIGDGDHGINLDRGLALVAARLERADPARTGPSVLREAGRIVLGSVGGASGALYGRALVRAGDALADVADPGPRRPPVRPGADSDPFAEAVAVLRLLDAAAESIASLGRARPGDKTMLDALDPARAAMRAAVARGLPLAEAAPAAADAAAAGADATVPLVARRGRASYLGERSRGHRDPGAASMALLLEALAGVVTGA
jgi:dihydroxyacetone kinase-like protein